MLKSKCDGMRYEMRQAFLKINRASYAYAIFISRFVRSVITQNVPLYQ